MRNLLLNILLLLAMNIYSEEELFSQYLISPITVQPDFVDTLTFISLWHFPTNVEMDFNGEIGIVHREYMNTKDSNRIHNTANCRTNFRGEHHIKYCKGAIIKDTLQLIFLPDYPNFTSSFRVFIIDNNFWCEFNADYPYIKIAEKSTSEIVKQNIILNHSSYKNGYIILGYIDIEFTVTEDLRSNRPKSQDYYFNGYFKTKLYSF